MAEIVDIESRMTKRRLLVLTDDHFLADVLGTYMVRDGIELETVGSAAAAARQSAAADGVLIDLRKRGLTGDIVLQLAQRVQNSAIALLIMSSRPRRDVADFAAVVRATDVVSKTEAIPAIAARIRVCMQTQVRYEAPSTPSHNTEWAFA